MNELKIESIAKALIINPHNEVLILTLSEHRSKPEKSFMPDLPGGLVDKGETEHDAVIREIMEETNITVDRTELMMVYSRTEFVASQNASITKHLFIAMPHQNTPVKLSWEHSAYKWLPIAELQANKLKSFYDEAIEYCFINKIID